MIRDLANRHANGIATNSDACFEAPQGFRENLIKASSNDNVEPKSNFFKFTRGAMVVAIWFGYLPKRRQAMFTEVNQLRYFSVSLSRDFKDQVWQKCSQMAVAHVIAFQRERKVSSLTKDSHQWIKFKVKINVVIIYNDSTLYLYVKWIKNSIRHAKNQIKCKQYCVVETQIVFKWNLNCSGEPENQFA